jgi:hypothetical protein
MATKDMAIVASVRAMYFDIPMLAVILGTETSNGVMPASALAIKFNSVAVGPDPIVDSNGDFVDPTITGDPKVFSYPNNPKDATANIVFERYYYQRTGGTPGTPFKSVIQAFDSGQMSSQAALDQIINYVAINNPNAYLTTWGGEVPTPGTVVPHVVNAYGIVRLGDFLYMISYDIARVTKIRASDKNVMGDIDFTQAGFDVRGQGIKVLEGKGKVYALFNVAGDINGTDVATANYQPSVVVEIDVASFTYSANRVQVGLNSVKLESTLDENFIFCPAIGGPQLAGQSNITRSGLYRIPVAADGTLGTVVKAYQGHTDPTFYDIRDIAIGQDYALILLGRWDANFANFIYVILKTQVTALAGLAANTNIYALYLNPTSLIDTDIVAGYGPFHVVRYEKSYAHFWAGQSVRIKVWDASVIASSTSPAPGRMFAADNNSSPPFPYQDPLGFYGGDGYLNSMDLFIDNTNAYAVPSPLRSASAGVAGGASGAGNTAKGEAAILRGFLLKRDAPETTKK